MRLRILLICLSGNKKIKKQKYNKNNMYHLYIIKCADDTLYTGIAVDLKRRIGEHNYSQLGAKYTRSRRPVKLVYSKNFCNRSTASKEEVKVKALLRKEKLEMIRAETLKINI